MSLLIALQCVFETKDSFPWTGGAMRLISEPKAAASAWCPKQTPRSGMLASFDARINSIDTPAFSGLPGPGDITMPSGLRAMISLVLKALFRMMSTLAPRSERKCHKFHVKLSKLSIRIIKAKSLNFLCATTVYSKFFTRIPIPGFGVKSKSEINLKILIYEFFNVNIRKIIKKIAVK